MISSNIIIVVSCVAGSIVLVACIVLVQKIRSWCHARQRHDSRMKWKMSHSKSLRGNFIMTYDAPIEEAYNIESHSLLGKGSFGVVVVGVHRVTGMQYAIKFVMKNSEQRHRIERELRLLKDVDHTNIVRLFAVYDTKDQVGFVMELCTGGHLLNLLERQPKRYLSENAARNLVCQLVSAVAHMHGRGICHRDIKMQNILMENYLDSAQIKIIDFGFGTRFIGATPLKTRCGTPYTTAPEVFREHYDERCDVWSAGVVAYILLSGRRPFEAAELPGALEPAGKASLVANILMGRYTLNHSPFKRVSPACLAFIQKMLVPDYRARWSAKKALQHEWLQNSPNKDSLSDSLATTESMLAALSNLRRQSSMSALHQSSMLAVVFSLPQNKTSELRDLFREFDIDHNGSLSLDEFRRAMKVMSQKLTNRDIDQLFETIDVNDDRQISFTEFLAATLDPREIDIEELGKAFRLLDSDNKGYLTVDDLHRVLAGKDTPVRNSLGDAVSTDTDGGLVTRPPPPMIIERYNIDICLFCVIFIICNRPVTQSFKLDVIRHIPTTGGAQEFGNNSDVEYSIVGSGKYNAERKNEDADTASASVDTKQMTKLQRKIQTMMDIFDTDHDGVISYAGNKYIL